MRTIGSLRVSSQGMKAIRAMVAMTTEVVIMGLENQSSRCPLSKVSSRQPRNKAISAKPIKSTLRLAAHQFFEAPPALASGSAIEQTADQGQRTGCRPGH